MNFVYAAGEAVGSGWTWRDTFTATAVVLSTAALWVSWTAYRQRVRYHPQPKLVAEWSQSIDTASGLFFRELKLYNRGDAAARDVRIYVKGTVNNPDGLWAQYELIDPAEFKTIRVPLVAGVRKGRGAYGVVYERDDETSTYSVGRPPVRIAWRQAPFGKVPRSLVEVPPQNPPGLPGN